MIDLESLDTVQPTALVLHAYGEAVGYAFFAPDFLILVKLDGSQIIKTTEDHLDTWLNRLSVDMGKPVEIWS